MAYRRTPFAVNEFFHCYTRGIDKRITFQDEQDYQRFIQALYVCNSVDTFHRASLLIDSHDLILQLDRATPLVSIVAYCLMPNHYHLILREIVEGGIARFMQKVGTMYTMYFNAKNERIGGLFVSPFRSKHINEDQYLKKVVSYIHLNPAELFESGWKKGEVRNMTTLEEQLRSYRFSSLPDYCDIKRPEQDILDWNIIHDTNDFLPPIKTIIDEAAEYYRGLKW